MSLLEQIEQKLTQNLGATHVGIVDNTWQHAGHSAAGGGAHLAITVVSPQFDGVGLMDRHRMVHQLLAAEMQGAIHALELKTLTPDAWAATARG